MLFAHPACASAWVAHGPRLAGQLAVDMVVVQCKEGYAKAIHVEDGTCLEVRELGWADESN